MMFLMNFSYGLSYVTDFNPYFLLLKFKFIRRFIYEHDNQHFLLNSNSKINILSNTEFLNLIKKKLNL